MTILGQGKVASRLIWGTILFLMLSAFGAAQDPKILICGASCDPPTIINLTPGTIQNVQPNGQNQVDYTFINQTGTIIDNFAFDTTINTGLSQSFVQSAFTCGDLLGFFMNCAVTYNSATGNLLYKYSGVNPPETGLAGLLDSFTNEQGEQEGIPPCTLGYLVCEYAEGGRGIFSIELDGWTANASFNGVPLYKGLPTLTNGFNVPEPSTVVVFLADSLLLAGVLLVARRKKIWISRFDG